MSAPMDLRHPEREEGEGKEDPGPASIPWPVRLTLTQHRQWCGLEKSALHGWVLSSVAARLRSAEVELRYERQLQRRESSAIMLKQVFKVWWDQRCASLWRSME